MAKIVFFSPRPEMVEQAQQVMRKLNINDVPIQMVTSSTCVHEAQKASASGVDIIIARGNQASLIRRYTNIPIVEVVLTAQEMGLLITQAKKMLNKENPVVGVVGFGNMFCDMRFFDEIYGIQLKPYLVNYTEEFESAVDQAAKDGVDVILGGEIALEYASKLNIPSLFISSSEDSIQQAFRVASSVAFASDLEKKNSAELKTLLDFSFNGIIKLNPAGEIVALNHLAEQLLRKSAAEVTGEHILNLFTSLDPGQLDYVLKAGQEVFSAFLHLRDTALAVNLAPIKIENRIEGAILSCHEVKKLNELEAEARRELFIQGRIPKYTFEWMEQNTKVGKDFIHQAKRFAQSDAPLLINGEASTDGEILAQSVHNSSLRKNGPYVSARCSAYSSDDQLTNLFGYGGTNGKNGIIAAAHNGTLFIDEVSELNSCAQYRLLKLMTENILIRGNDDRPLPVNIRVITSSDKSLWSLVEEGRFRRDLFYALSTLSLSFIPFRERKEEIEQWIEHYIKTYCTTYSRFITLTKGARTVLSEYPWDGNHIQLRSFCERLVITSTKRSVDEIMVSRLLTEAYPVTVKRKSSEPIIVYKNPEAAHIADLLEKHKGSRSHVAEEMGISTTTLWRKMNKYKITGKFEV